MFCVEGEEEIIFFLVNMYFGCLDVCDFDVVLEFWVCLEDELWVFLCF